MIKHLIIKIHGRVQGVFFRWSAKEKAEELGINGFVRNEPDKTVRIETEGEEGDLKRFLEWCREGSELSTVEKIEYEFGEEIKGFKGFTIN